MLPTKRCLQTLCLHARVLWIILTEHTMRCSSCRRRSMSLTSDGTTCGLPARLVQVCKTGLRKGVAKLGKSIFSSSKPLLLECRGPRDVLFSCTTSALVCINFPPDTLVVFVTSVPSGAEQLLMKATHACPGIQRIGEYNALHVHSPFCRQYSIMLFFGFTYVHLVFIHTVREKHYVGELTRIKDRKHQWWQDLWVE